MSSTESQLSVVDSVARSVEGFCEGKLYGLRHRRKVSTLCSLHNMHHRTEHYMHEYLHHFIATCNARASAALRELALVIPLCRTDYFSRSFLPAAVCLWNLLSTGVFSGGTLRFLKSYEPVPTKGLTRFFLSLYFRLFLLLYSFPSTPFNICFLLLFYLLSTIFCKRKQSSIWLS